MKSPERIRKICRAHKDGRHGTLKTTSIPGAEGRRYGKKEVCEDCGEIVYLAYYD